MSLDGAVVLIVPVVLVLGRHDAALRRTLLLGTVAVANAFSLAVPQGNPTNLVVMRRLDLAPITYLEHMLVPALLATLICAAVPAYLGRATLASVLPSRGYAPPKQDASPTWARDERFAAAALATAALAAAVTPWLGIPPLSTLVVVAAATYAIAHAANVDTPALPVPWRLAAQIAALVALVGLLPAIHVAASTLLGAIAVALTATALAAALNNLPASIALAGTLGAPGITAYAALAGLSVGALATPRGSVATIIAFRRAGGSPGRRGAVALAALTATGLATAALWALR